MSTEVVFAPGEPRLRAMDPDLPFLASRAAIELDAVLRGQDVGLEALRLLAEQLRNTVVTGSSNGGPRSLIDPATLTVLGDAVNRSSSPDEAVVKIDDLIEKARKIADDLLGSTPSTRPEALAWARTFCVSLSESSASYCKSVHDLHPEHPYRR